MKFAVLSFFIVFCGLSVFSQAPQGIPYQAVARDNQGSFMENQPVTIRFSLHDLSAAGQVVYQETQNTTTDALGLFSLTFGAGVPSIGAFGNINWGSGYKFLQVEADFGTGYSDMGTQQLMSVPYALYSGSSGNVSNNQNSNYNPSADSVLTLVGKRTLSPGTYVVPEGEVWELEAFNLDGNSEATADGVFYSCENMSSSSYYIKCRYWLPTSTILVMSLDGWEFYTSGTFGSTGGFYNGQPGVLFDFFPNPISTDCNVCPPIRPYTFTGNLTSITMTLPVYATPGQELFIQNGYRVSVSKFK